jgi:Fe-S oxidoreductase
VRNQEEDRYRFFGADRCVLCGECLTRCPELRLTAERAREEKARLNRGETGTVLRRSCTSCFDCNFYCPHQVNPCDQIVHHWWREYRQKGLLERARYFLPLEPLNFRTYVTDRLPRDERERLESWNDPGPCEAFIYPGCNICTVPYLTESRLLPHLPIRGGLDWCCGEMLYRMGCYDLFETQGRRMRERFGDMGAVEIVMPCTAGTAIFTQVLPLRFGIRFDATFRTLLSYLWDGLASGAIRIERKLGLTATIQDSCHAKFLEPDYIELPRKILERIGIRVVEMPRSRAEMVCCGIGAGFSIESGYHPLRLTLSTVRRLWEARRTGADVLCVYCAGCLQMLGVGSLFYPRSPEIYHILELVQLAAGERPVRRMRNRALTLFLGVMRHHVPGLFNRGRFFPDT